MVEQLGLLVPSERVTQVFQRMNELGAARRPFLFALDYELEEGFVWDDPETYPPCQIAGLEVPLPNAESLEPPRLDKVLAEDEAIYARRFARVYEALLYGDSFLTNLTIRSEIMGSLSLECIYTHCPAPYKLMLPGRFVCFTPESFVQIDEGGCISTFPMKGTIDATLPDAALRLRSDYKESCEHHTIVDLMRNDLNRIAEGIAVRQFKFLSEIKTHRGRLLQMSSEVAGQLATGWEAQLGDLFASLLPAGSISGAPKERTCEVIREAEGMRRGFYTGVFGYFDGKQVDSAVLIRFVEQCGDRFFFRSGGGVTVNSQMHEEYEECLAKVYLPQQ